MELIASFSVDHRKIVPGIFTSRTDEVGGQFVTTYDIRLKRPNAEPALNVAAMHSLEHVIATIMRNDPKWKNEVVYWGPMGCLTGFYLILKGNRPSREIFDFVLNAFKGVESFEEVPGATPESCGNYLLHDLALAKTSAREFALYLERHKDDPSVFEYPKSERPVTDDGRVFFDS